MCRVVYKHMVRVKYFLMVCAEEKKTEICTKFTEKTKFFARYFLSCYIMMMMMVGSTITLVQNRL